MSCIFLFLQLYVFSYYLFVYSHHGNKITFSPYSFIIPIYLCPKIGIFLAMIYWYSSLLFLLLYSQYILVVLSYADEQEWSLYLFLYIPTQEMFSYSLEFYLEIIPYPFYKYLPSIAGYPHNVVLSSIYCMC